jgi:hypothetical protein
MKKKTLKKNQVRCLIAYKSDMYPGKYVATVRGIVWGSGFIVRCTARTKKAAISGARAAAKELKVEITDEQ